MSGMPRSKEQCHFWDGVSCHYEMLFLGCSPCGHCPEESDLSSPVSGCDVNRKGYREKISTSHPDCASQLQVPARVRGLSTVTRPSREYVEMVSNGSVPLCNAMAPVPCGHSAVAVILVSMPPSPDGYRHWRAVPCCLSHPAQTAASQLAASNPQLTVVITRVQEGMIVQCP